MPSSNFQKVPSFERLRNLNTSVTFNGKFGTFSNFQKKRGFFLENPSVFQAKSKILTVGEILLFPSHCAAYFLPSAIEKKLNIFFRISHLFFKKSQILNVSRNLTISVALYGKFATFSNF